MIESEQRYAGEHRRLAEGISLRKVGVWLLIAAPVDAAIALGIALLAGWRP